MMSVTFFQGAFSAEDAHIAAMELRALQKMENGASTTGKGKKKAASKKAKDKVMRDIFLHV